MLQSNAEVYSTSISSGSTNLGRTSRSVNFGVISPRLPFLLAVFAQLLCLQILVFGSVLQQVHCLSDHAYDIVCYQQFAHLESLRP